MLCAAVCENSTEEYKIRRCETPALKIVGKSFSTISPLQVLESQQKTCEDLTNCLVEAGATIAAREMELKKKDEEIAALKKRLQASEQKLQREEAKNAWLHEVTNTLTSEIQKRRNEDTKAKLTGKVPD
ncbi:hypothetical protein R1flu_005069 [Riccia fluitans]|uniref:Uncharacterized protein n=1 Tax=Riccia fluitans TaxID=41844 RepID=A0ABD1YS39_9MARC